MYVVFACCCPHAKQCKICNEKQSVRRVWARSDAGKDIRIAVQTLNMKAAER